MTVEEMMNRVRGFQESRAILTGVELDVFDAIGEGATAAQVAERIGANPRSTAMLLNALVACEVLAKTGEIYSNTEASRTLIGPGRMAQMHIVHLWNTWSTLTEAVRSGTCVPEPERATREAAWTEAFIAAMHNLASAQAATVAHAIGLDRVRRVLDVGGGSGAYSIAFAQASPVLQAEILDLEPVTVIARRHIEAAGLTGRIRTRVGDLRSDPLGSSEYDLVYVSAINHMLDEAENADLIRRCFQACAPGGRLVIREFVLNNDRTAPKHAALFALNMLVGTRAGNSYTEGEYRHWLAQAGFKDVSHLHLPGTSDLIIGVRARGE
jgi:SAM-dependent methyltransferase/DNA-binding CsgD family transcriptional regulator